MDSTGKFLIIALLIASVDYLAIKLINLITKKKTRIERNYDKEFWNEYTE